MNPKDEEVMMIKIITIELLVSASDANIQISLWPSILTDWATAKYMNGIHHDSWRYCIFSGSFCSRYNNKTVFFSIKVLWVEIDHVRIYDFTGLNSEAYLIAMLSNRTICEKAIIYVVEYDILQVLKVAIHSGIPFL